MLQPHFKQVSQSSWHLPVDSSTCTSKSSVRLLPVTDASMQPLLAVRSSTHIFSLTWQGTVGEDAAQTCLQLIALMLARLRL